MERVNILVYIEIVQDNDYYKNLKKKKKNNNKNQNQKKKKKNVFRYRRIRIPNKSNAIVSPLSSGTQKIQSYIQKNNRTIEDFFILPMINNDRASTITASTTTIIMNNNNQTNTTSLSIIQQQYHQQYDDNNNHDQDTCQPMGKWMTVSFVNCNTIHELDVQGSVSQHDDTDLVLLGQGWFRSTWKYTTYIDPTTTKDKKNKKKSSPSSIPSSSVVLKTLRIEREFIEEYYELHRRDAVAMERLTFSPYVMDVYG